VFLAESFLERNSWITGIVVPIAVGIAVLAIERFWHRKDRSTKTLDYRVIDDLPILANRPDDDDLKVTYMDEEVNHPRIVRVRFTNTGKQVIKSTDFLEPYVISCRTSNLLDATITDESDQNLVMMFETDSRNSDGNGTITLTCNTLNTGDTFTVQLIVDSEKPTGIKVSGRIEGQTRRSAIYPTSDERSQIRNAFTALAAVGAVLMLFGGIVFAATGGWIANSGWVKYTLGLGTFSLGLLIAAFSGWAYWLVRYKIAKGIGSAPSGRRREVTRKQRPKTDNPSN
jgi:hypothetical protein